MVMTPRRLFLCRTFSTAGLLPLLPASRNGTHGLGRAEAFWNSFSCDPSIAVLQSVPAFLLSQASVGPRSCGEVARQHANARSNQRFVEPFSLLGTYSLPSASLTCTFAGLTTKLSGGATAPTSAGAPCWAFTHNISKYVCFHDLHTFRSRSLGLLCMGF
jgi:hypothetical protein